MNNIYLFKREKKESLVVKTDLKITSALQQLEVYWYKLRAGNTPPRRSQICATKIQNILPFIFLIDYAPKKGTFLKFIGTSAKLNLKKLSIHTRSKSLIHLDINTTFKTCLTDLFFNANPQKLDLHPYTSSVSNTPLISIGLFPLLDRYGETTKAIGVIESKCI